MVWCSGRGKGRARGRSQVRIPPAALAVKNAATSEMGGRGPPPLKIFFPIFKTSFAIYFGIFRKTFT